MSDAELRDYIRRARAIAEPKGSLHGWWDVIFDAEAILAGKDSLLSREKVEQEFRDMFSVSR